jgi:hypothetical protein
LHRSNDDKRKAVFYVLADAEWSKLSSRAIAEICGVSDKFVGSIRADGANGSHHDEPRTGKDGVKQPAKKQEAKPKADPKPEPKDDPDDDDDAPSYAQTEDHWEDVPDEPEPAKPEQADSPQALAAPIQAVATQLTSMLKELKRLADYSGGEWLDLTDLETQINLLKHSIRQSVYWIDCMDCGGKGCKTCRKLGWLSLDRKKYLTQEQKDKVGL